MKKIVMIFAIAIVLTAAGGWIYKTVSAEEATVTTTTATTATYPYGPMMGRGGSGFRGGCGGYAISTTAPTYEWLYLHLDADEKTLVDAYHADLLATYDFTVMDAEARLAALDEIRAALADYIVDAAFVTGVNP